MTLYVFWNDGALVVSFKVSTCHEFYNYETAYSVAQSRICGCDLDLHACSRPFYAIIKNWINPGHSFNTITCCIAFAEVVNLLVYLKEWLSGKFVDFFKKMRNGDRDINKKLYHALFHLTYSK